MQRETYYSQLRFRYHQYFNPLPLCRGRLPFSNSKDSEYNFNPLPLCRGRLLALIWDNIDLDISILSLYAEGDPNRIREIIEPANFNPLPLCRGRLSLLLAPKLSGYFNPLPLCRGRRHLHPHLNQFLIISILSLYAEGDA